MDPLSIASGVAGLLTLAGSVISTGYTLASKINHRDEQVKALVQEIAIFSGILVGVQGRVKANGSEPYGHLDLRDGPSLQDVLESCTKTLNEAGSLFQSVGELNPVKLLLKGEAVKEQMDSITGRVEHYKSFFTLYLQLQSGAQSDEMKTTLNMMVQQLGSLHSGQERIQNDLNAKELAKQRSEIINWLGSVESQQEEIREERDAESGAWIFKRDEFDAWLSSEKSSYLWLNGTQGTGKTTIVSKIIELLEEATSLEESSALAFHYCQFSNSTTLSQERVIGALVSQLLSTRPNITLPTSLQELFKKPSSKKAHPPLKEIAQIFAEICADLSEVYIIIDGLDELKRRKGMIWFLHHLSDLCPNVKLKVIISSRPEIDLEMAFEFYGSVSIGAADNLEDMERYVRRQVEHLELEDEIEANELIETMVQKADGMFLWVVYQLNHLSRIRTAINSSLIQDLPKGLEKTFESTLNQLEGDDKVLALDILRWLMFAKRPLSLEEVVEAIAIKPETKTLAQLQTQRLRRSSDIFEICGSLIRQSKISGKLSLAHYSIFEWLSSRKLSTGITNEFYLDLDHANALMTQACAVYLSLDVYGTTEFTDLVQMTLAIQHDRLDPEATPSILSQSRFLDYASRYWWAHIAKGFESESIPEPVMTALKNFFQLESNFNSWVGISSYLYGDYRYPPGIAPLHVAVLHGLKWLTTSLLNENPGSLYMTTSDGRLPLHIALENDGGELINLLLPYKTHVDLLDNKGRSPLQLAIYSGNAKVARKLIHAGASVNAPFPDGGTALSTAIENGWEELAELISNITEIDTLQNGRSLLHVAAQSGNIVWVSNLIKSHAEMVRLEDANGWTPLHEAADNGHVNVVSLLLNAGCLIHPRDYNGWTPLHAAVHRHHSTCIRKLVTADPAGSVSWSSTPMKLRDFRGLSSSPERLRTERQGLDKKYGRHYSVGDMNQTRPPFAKLRSLQNYLKRTSLQVKSSKTQSPGAIPDPLYIAVSDSYTEGIEILLQTPQPLLRDLFNIQKSLFKALEFPIPKILETLLSQVTDEEAMSMIPDMAASDSPSAVTAIKTRLVSVRVYQIIEIFDKRWDFWEHTDYEHWKLVEFILDHWSGITVSQWAKLYQCLVEAIDKTENDKEEERKTCISKLCSRLVEIQRLHNPLDGSIMETKPNNVEMDGVEATIPPPMDEKKPEKAGGIDLALRKKRIT